MSKVTFIGSGSLVFTRNLCNDILLSPALEGSTIALMDVDPERLEQSRQIVQAIVDRHNLPARVEAHLDRVAAIRDADYVVTTFQQGGLEAYALDIEIDAGTGRPHVGLCHSVQHTSEMLATWIDVPYEEVVFFCAGINHQAFFLEFRRGEVDLYPRIIEAAERPEIYGTEPVRIELMRHFGYFVTESSGHCSEYSPYFRKNAKMVERELVPKFTDAINDWLDYGRTGGYLRHCHDRLKTFQEEFGEILAEEPPLARTHEYGVHVIEAMETNCPIRINGNVPNTRLIDNLPEGCCVEVPCLVDGNGIQPTNVGLLPPQLAALNQTNINVQALIVEAALTGSREAVYHAVMLDPLTAAVCTLPQIRKMVDNLLAAQARWIKLKS